MLFNSLKFIIFFIIAYLIYLVIPKRVRKGYLLMASYYFYMCWNPLYILLLVGSTLVTYLCGLFVTKYGKKVLALSLVLNFSLLFVFKYLDFAYGTVAKGMSLFGVMLPEFSSGLLLPIGISFYIFQAVGYTIDVYRGDTKPEKNILTYALFVSFFPQLVAGPIERSKRLLGQLNSLHELNVRNFEKTERGFVTALYGFFMKMVIADRAAIYVDHVFDEVTFSLNAGFPVILAIVLFSIQIYCDFAGYTFIAIGVSEMMGIDLCVNFRQPYFAKNIKDFWDRWHISLSTFFRDYLYFPLGGSRKGKLRKYINLAIVFVISGLWHGAAWHFVAWGLLHGLARIAYEASKGLRNFVKTKITRLGLMNFEAESYGLFERLVTFSFVSIAWVFFRCKSLSMAVSVLKNAFSCFNPWTLSDGSLFNYGLSNTDFNILSFSLFLMILVDVFAYKGKDLKALFVKQNPLFKLLFTVLVIGFIALAGVYGPLYDASQFIYFQF